jgi:hypothetical protein
MTSLSTKSIGLPLIKEHSSIIRDNSIFTKKGPENFDKNQHRYSFLSSISI